MDPNSHVIGIDLGTRYSCASIRRNKRTEVICDQFGNRTIPSVVSFYRSAKLVGANALTMKDVNPLNTIYDIKRIIGRRSDDEIIDQVKKLISYDIVDDQSAHHNILVQLDRKDYTTTRKTIYRPEEICGFILIEIKRMAERYVGNPVTDAVITVPAYFNDSQRQATLDSAKIAGLNVLKIINEPTAAALAYGFGAKTNGNVIIYDLGAGTLDISLMNISGGAFRVLGVGGSTHLGGEDVDYLLMSHILGEFKRTHRIRDLAISKLSQVKLKNAVENAKKILSTAEKSVVCVDDFYRGKQLYYVISRNFFEIICNEFFIMCIKPLRDVLDGAGLDRDEIDDVIMVGGSTRIPKIRQLVLDFFKGTKIKSLTSSLNPDEVVSAGASIYGYMMVHKEDPFSENLVLLDITPLSLGVETLQKQMTVVIPRNTVIPTRKTKIFSTDTDNQSTVSIKIFEGERKLTKNNFYVGTFDLSGFATGPRGYPTIKITFHVDINGILQVTALEKKSDVQNSIKITSTWGAKGRLSKADIDKIIIEAEANDQIDTVYSLKVGLIHKINSMCNAILINLKDDAYKLTNTDKKKIRIDVKRNLSWLKANELDDLAVDELEKRQQRMSKTYAPLIAQLDKNQDKFKNFDTKINAADVHGDDDTDENFEQYQSVDLQLDPSEYDKEEIKALKRTISDLGKNIMTVVNNPVSKFTSEDIDTVSDYIGSVQIWLYTTPANTSIEFISKIDEINKFTEEMMKKYEDKNIFEKSQTFTTRDELQLTCITINNSIKSNFFTIKSDSIQKLSKLINKTMHWLIAHQKEQPCTYKSKLDKINILCNDIYHSMHKFKILEDDATTVDGSDDEDTDDDEDNAINDPGIKIKENIDNIINCMPDKLINKKRMNKDVLLKIDMDKLNHTSTLKYKNANVYHG